MISRSSYAACGPRKIRAGRNNIPRSNSRTPSTAIPTIRNGSKISQTNGYSSKASKASGQHSTSKMHHSRNFTIASLGDPTILLRRNARFRSMRVPRNLPSRLLPHEGPDLLDHQVDSHVVVPAFGNNHVRIPFRRLDELHMHRPHGIHVLLDDHLHRPSALTKIAD